jgi:protocatechuate 3,4-dioxygenase alpha subunit
MTQLQTTAWQTAGPFFTFALIKDEMRYVVPQDQPDAIEITGRIFDGQDEVVPDAIVETWQAGSDGVYRSDPVPEGQFQGFGRAGCDTDGRFRIITAKPGAVAEDDGTVQAPHLEVSIFARGVMNRLVTRFYFEDEAALNEQCPVLSRVDAKRRHQLVATALAPRSYGLEIHLQGDLESPFFAI